MGGHGGGGGGGRRVEVVGRVGPLSHQVRPRRAPGYLVPFPRIGSRLHRGEPVPFVSPSRHWLVLLLQLVLLLRLLVGKNPLLVSCCLVSTSLIVSVVKCTRRPYHAPIQAFLPSVWFLVLLASDRCKV